MNHTPGPWIANDFPTELPTHTVLYVRAGSEHVCQCWLTGCDRGLDNQERLQELHANARLIAAAPELLEALKTLCAPTIVRPVGFGERYERAEAAIAAAGD